MRRQSVNKRNGRRKTTQTKFRPNRSVIDQATEDYLKKGGRITKIIDVSEGYEEFLSSKGIPAADSFLLGQ